MFDSGHTGHRSHGSGVSVEPESGQAARCFAAREPV